jgi:RHS repeat-associated protein
MAGISSQAAGKLENLYKANGGDELQHKEFGDGSGLETYDANFRMYDAQIGRFWQQDPLEEINESQSPYSFVYNNPVSFSGPFGLDSTKAPGFPNSTTGANNLKPVTVTATARQNRSFVVTPPGNVPGVPGLQIPPSSPGGTTVNPPTPTPTPTPTPDVPTVEPDEPDPQWIPELVTGPALVLTFIFTFIPITGHGHEGDLPKYHKPKVDNPYKGPGNRIDNPDPHIVYEFLFTPTDTRTPVLKYGISDELRWGMDRPEVQLAGMQARFGASVTWFIYTRAINRSQALFFERLLVTQHFNKWGEMPRAQYYPRPFPPGMFK